MTAVWRDGGLLFPTLEMFLKRFREVFDHSKDGKSAGDLLLALTQGRRSAGEYALTLRTLAAQTTWVDDTLKSISWQEAQITRWLLPSLHPCHHTSSTPKSIPGLLTVYYDLREAFSKAKASELPPHRPSVCAINLLLGTTPPRGQIFPLLGRNWLKALFNYLHPQCKFHLTSVSFLGYVISHKVVAMDESKDNAVLNWPLPNTIKELQRLLGFANFYHRFIRGFSSVAASLTNMIKRGSNRLHWSFPAQEAFKELKQCFTTAPILHHPDPNLPFIVNASNIGIGAILSQCQGSPAKMFLCTFYSIKLNSAERKYDVGDRELLAMKAAAEEWRHWLEGTEHLFTVLTDHQNLKYLKTAKQLNPRRAKDGHCSSTDIVSNRSPQFTSLLWFAVFKALEVNVSLTSGYHPQSNGQVERLNQELTRFLRSYCREPSNVPAVNDWIQTSEETWNQAHHHLQHAVRRNKLTGIAVLAQNTPLASGYGCPPETSISICHVASSVPGTWAHFK
ncbi:Transposon Tf2-11 polyprotein [Labeo rohita]|uniref:Transposon Tf2-11 polyprotein n=1 Tax=Labeo rohita TaxID=84645 RepID=A0ABQ8MBT3_LABRO|nr:Transposon Tf2-11 polyprotein [Labeo rohita]